ncbi:unnamed protein product [Kuraishia capsulata CBS 1993]|uniref:AMP-activated protein kinase glycogen-binding domain-containing protein n=1 Tax=Kuraishia capsulata CBS 1993 TaxID=1382522 RepID=W6MGR6_9ASCO|nr:uncharacterized protein KUCA_T00000998001 [Kuraishia capsulata CBS 1993]CDK25031.1 unnamed protein product [Kuraishia capsulata CBS 1993]
MKYTFEWPSSANEVYVTGTFDNWSKSVLLNEENGKFSKTLSLPDEKVFYKFVVDGNWVLSSAKVETDADGIANHVLYPEDIKSAEPVDSEDRLSRTRTHETEASQFTSISFPASHGDAVQTQASGSPALIDADIDDMSSSTQVTLDGADDSSITLNSDSPQNRAQNARSNASGGARGGVLSKFKSLFR